MCSFSGHLVAAVSGHTGAVELHADYRLGIRYRGVCVWW